MVWWTDTFFFHIVLDQDKLLARRSKKTHLHTRSRGKRTSAEQCPYDFFPFIGINFFLLLLLLLLLFSFHVSRVPGFIESVIPDALTIISSTTSCGVLTRMHDNNYCISYKRIPRPPRAYPAEVSVGSRVSARIRFACQTF